MSEHLYRFREVLRLVRSHRAGDPAVPLTIRIELSPDEAEAVRQAMRAKGDRLASDWAKDLIMRATEKEPRNGC